MPWSREPVIAKGAQPLSWMLRMSAPICRSGVMIRFIGRFWMEASPVRVTEKSWAARMPEISRVVVPLLPQSRTESGFFKPRMPWPWTSTWLPFRSMETPIF